jgi:hypothetical protein
MAPKEASKKPTTGGKAPAGKAPAAEKKEAGKKTAAAPSGEKKKRGKTRKETYSSYIYKGELNWQSCAFASITDASFQSSSKFTPTLVSPTVPCPS